LIYADGFIFDATGQRQRQFCPSTIYPLDQGPTSINTN